MENLPPMFFAIMKLNSHVDRPLAVGVITLVVALIFATLWSMHRLNRGPVSRFIDAYFARRFAAFPPEKHRQVAQMFLLLMTAVIGLPSLFFLMVGVGIIENGPKPVPKIRSMEEFQILQEYFEQNRDQ